MTTIQHNLYIQELYVKHYEGAPNAVARVRWMCVLSRGAGKVFAAGQTDLQQPDPQSFINIAELEAQQVIDWVLATLGGQAWLDGFIAAHEEAMQQAEADAAFEPWHIPLVNPLKFDPANV
jgi:hypothetical protein